MIETNRNTVTSNYKTGLSHKGQRCLRFNIEIPVHSALDILSHFPGREREMCTRHSHVNSNLTAYFSNAASV